MVSAVGVTGARLLGLPVRLRGIQLGRPVDLLLDLANGRALGLDVLCGDERHRFLPLSTATVSAAELSVASALMLVDGGGAFYHDRAERLRTLRGKPVEHDGSPVGVLRDVVIGTGGHIDEVVVDSDGQLSKTVSDGRLRVGGRLLRC